MDGATLNAKVSAGYAKAALRIGTTYHHFRPTTANTPLAAGNQLADMLVSLNADDPRYSKPNVYGKATWYAVADASQFQVGDYIVGVEGTLFVAALQQLLPIFMVDCNRVASFNRPQQQSGVGALSYGGTTAANETALAASWPCSILQDTKKYKSDVDLPGDVRDPWWAILAPTIPGVTLRNGDIMTDDLGRKYIIGSAELTDLGWRLTAQQAQT